MLTKEVRNFLQSLLEWDKSRITDAEKLGYDCSVYKQRQNGAQLALNEDPQNWPEPVRELFMAVLEVVRMGNSAVAHGVLGTVLVPEFKKTQLFQKAAKEIHVLHHLKAVAPRHWSNS